MKTLLTGLLICSISFSSQLFAQDTLAISLQEAIDVALKNNQEITLARLDEEIAQARFRQTNAVFLPHLQLSYTALSTNNPLNAFGFKLQQQSIQATDFNPALLNDPSATQNFMTKIAWQQPLLNMDKLSQRKAAQHLTDVYAFKTKRTSEYIALEARKAYAQLQLSYQAKEALDEAVQTMNSIHKNTVNYFEKGLIQKADVLLVKVQLTRTENQLAEANSNVRNASDYLSLLMGNFSDVIYTPAKIETETADLVQPQIPDNRADFMAMQSAIEAQTKMINSGKMSVLPQLNAFAEYLINDKEAFGFGADSYLIGAQLSWNIFNGTANHNKIAEYKAERDKLTKQLSYQKEQGQVELNRALRQLDDLKITLQQHDVAVSQATEALRILQNRYDQGLVNTNDLLQTQNTLSEQKLRQAQAIYNYNTTLAYVQFLAITNQH